MCGIAGWYRRGRGAVLPGAITAQCDAIRHRGPDDHGVLVDGDFGFGMRRLSILDIAGGHQPMRTRDRRYSIVFNGEIYNHRELRRTLEAEGFPFETNSDTETALAAYARWRDGAWSRLEGMFAIAVWDGLSRTLALARDPLGIKPLYVHEQDGAVAFASELKALEVLPGFDPGLCDRAVHDFFSFGHVRRPRSIYDRVRMLDPGHFATVPAHGPTTSTCFWQPVPHVVEGVADAEWIDRMRSMLIETTARHMQSDVPVGAFLSGGVDSAAVLAAATRGGHGGVKAFTVGYPGAAIDETAHAAEIARHLGCEHVVLPLEPRSAIDALPLVQRCFDEPFADMAAVPTWYASKAAAEHVKVVLCGEGGDELFAGYKRHRNAAAVERYRSAIDALGPLLSRADRWSAGRSTRLNYVRQHIRRLGEFASLPDGYQQFFAATQISSRSVRERIYDPQFRMRHEGDLPYADLEEEYFAGTTAAGGNALERFLRADLTVNMPSAMLTRLDRTSMAHSVEARVPLLSHRMVDWAHTVPSDLKLRRGTGKFLLRRAIAPWLPRSAATRRKQGFQMPLAGWFRGDFGAFARSTWHDSGAARAGYLNEPAVEALFREHRLGQADHSRMLYAIAVFGLWWQNRSSSRQTGRVAMPA